MPLFTIFTGTYNSISIIGRVFKSLESQTIKDFEWIVIDDCSTDGTLEKLHTFRAKHTDWQITIVEHKTNTGVQTSRKEALDIAQGNYFVTWDHDDEQASNQLEIYSKLWEEFDSSDTANIFAKMTDQHGQILGAHFPKEPYISDYISVHNKYLTGSKEKNRVVEHHVCSKTSKFKEVLNHYQMNPHLLDGNIPNGGDVWSMMAYLGNRTIYTNQRVRKYYISEPGRKSMSDVKRSYNPHRVMVFKLLWVNYYDKRVTNKEWIWKLRNIFGFLMYGNMAGNNLVALLKMIKPPLSKIIGLVLFLPAHLLSRKYLNEKS